MPRVKRQTSSNSPIDVHTTIQMPNSAPPEKKTDEKPEFFTYMHSLSPEDWKNHIVYLTRENPKTSINGIGGYLTKLQQPFDIEDIKLAFGGYEFSYIMKNKNELVYSGRFRVEAPPKYDPSRENTAAPASANGAAGVGGDVLKVLEQQNERLYQVLTTLQGAKDENPAVAGALDILTDAYKKGLSAVAAGNGGNGDPSKQLESVLALAERIVTVRGGGGGGIMETITLLKELGIFSKPKTLAEQLAEAKSLVELIGGGGDGAPKDWKSQLARAAVDNLPQILETFKGNAANTAEAARARVVEAQLKARAAESLRGVPHPAATAAAPPANPSGLNVVPRDSTDPTPAAAPAAAAPAEGLHVGGQSVTPEQFNEAMKVNVVNLFRQGASGSSIASFIEDVNPEFAADFLTYSPQQVRMFFSADPTLKLMVDDPRFDEMLEEAREYMSDNDPVPVSN